MSMYDTTRLSRAQYLLWTRPITVDFGKTRTVMEQAQCSQPIGPQRGQGLGELARGISLTGERVENVVPLMRSTYQIQKYWEIGSPIYFPA